MQKNIQFLIWATLFIMCSLSFKGATVYPKGVFRNPVGHPIVLAGNFGELRPNHFHAGLDIKGELGEPVYAAADGYVSKVQVLPRGYGKILVRDIPAVTILKNHADPSVV